MRLLSAGKSLVGLKDHASRYRMGTPGMLPKFGSKRNPFGGERKGSQVSGSATSPVSTSAPLDAPKTVCSVKASPDMKESLFGRARTFLSAVGCYARKKVQPVRVVPPLGNGGKEYPRTVRAKLTGWIEKMKKRTWRGRTTSSRKVTTRSRKAPVQEELSLDKIKVVRNDLSDTDFEVVTRQRVRSSAAKTQIETATKAEPIERADAAPPRGFSGRPDEVESQSDPTGQIGERRKEKGSAPPLSSAPGLTKAGANLEETRKSHREMESGSVAAVSSQSGAGWLAAVKR